MANFIIGLDIGIGSIGWAILNLDKLRIEDLGVRIFDSGELPKEKSRLSQQRRGYRSTRRLVRRRSHRKARLKNFLQLIGLIRVDKIDLYFESANCDPIQLRYKGLSEKLSQEEIAACLIHIANKRGYRDFYEIDEESLSKAELKEYRQEREGVARIEEIMKSGGYKTPAEMIYKDDEFCNDNSDYRKYRNRSGIESINLISRKMLENEVSLILDTQKKFYKCLTEENIDKIKDIIFSQRDFETGPGNENDKSRKFAGYLDTLGKCRYFKDESRGARFTLLADIYSLVNVLSQYNYTNSDGNPYLDRNFANEAINTALISGNLKMNDIKKIAKKYGLNVNSESADTPITKCVKYIKAVKPVFEQFGYSWEDLIANYTDIENNLLNKIGKVLSESQTPRRRIDKLKELSAGLDDRLIARLSSQKFSGTSNVSYKYMKGAIESFIEGDIYGKYQASTVKEQPVIDEMSKPAKLPPFRNEDDCEFFKNPVVFRSINETRKVINAIIDKYGYPCAVNIETADELNRSFEDRAADTKRNKENQAQNDLIVKHIIEISGMDEKTARGYIERYKLWEAQEHKCLYSGRDIVIEDVLNDRSHMLEVDHIVPYSLILDNTLNNKALIYASENQSKGQRTPLMYMDAEKAKGFKARVNAMFKSNKCSKKKYSYLMLESLDAADLLDEWKSRNLNDTRYISKYLVNYLRQNLRFNTSGELPEDITIKNSSRVFAVKSRFTAQFRRQWLNEQTWGRFDKQALKSITYLDHAADAIVIANCRPEYVILAGEKIKLSRMYHSAGKKITKEYTESKQNCIDSLYNYYRMDKRKAEKLLSSHSSRLTPIIVNLAAETDNRLRDLNTHREFFDKGSSDEEIIRVFEATNRDLYPDDPEFAASLKLPVVSVKPERTYTGAITTDNPISIKETDGVLMQLKRTDIGEIRLSDIDNIRTDDKDLIDSLRTVLSEKKDTYTIADYLKETSRPFFITKKGRRIRKVTVMSAAPARHLKKEISQDNYSLLDDRSYYCVEVYKDSKGNNNARGISMSDIVKKNGKLWLKPDVKTPSDYCTHVMNLLPGDYIRIYKPDGKIKFEGYYKSVYNINEPSFYYIANNLFDGKKRVRISKSDKIIKLNIDILGKVTGENNGEGIKCGEPLSLLKAKN